MTLLSSGYTAFYLKPAEGGLGAITLVDEMGKCDEAEYRIVVKSDRLTKVTGRFPRQEPVRESGAYLDFRSGDSETRSGAPFRMVARRQRRDTGFCLATAHLGTD